MLTPLEIENKKFKKELIGYSVAEVEEFVQLVTESYETIYKENLANRDKINMLSSAIKQYKTMEETLQNAILVAQSAGEEVTRNAKAKAENIINEAQNSAAQILADAGKEVTKVSYEYEEMKRNVEVFRTRIISLLTSQLDIVKEFSMPESGKRAEEKAVETAPGAEDTEKAETTDIFEVANDVVKSISGVAKKAGITVTAEGDSALVNGGKSLIFEMIYNLCDNALKYNRENGSVKVTVGSAGGSAFIRVSDTGIGIAPEHIDRIFERFYRVDKSRSKQSGGTGLGLSIVKHIALSLGGKISTESKPGYGTEITVSLPIAEK